jgi:hypothetical protein
MAQRFRPIGSIVFSLARRGMNPAQDRGRFIPAQRVSKTMTQDFSPFASTSN